MNTRLARVSQEEIVQIVKDYVAGKIFTMAQVPTEELPRTFLPIEIGFFDHWTPEELSELGLIYEYLSEQTEPSREKGIPKFFTMRMLHRDDLEIFLELLPEEEAQQAGLADWGKA